MSRRRIIAHTLLSRRGRHCSRKPINSARTWRNGERCRPSVTPTPKAPVLFFVELVVAVAPEVDLVRCVTRAFTRLRVVLLVPIAPEVSLLSRVPDVVT